MMKMIKRLAAGLVLAALSLAPAFGQGAGQLGAGQMLANPTANPSRGQAVGISTYFDFALCATRGAKIERGASGWTCVVPSATAGLPWISNGTGADPSYGIAAIVGGGTGANTASGARTNLGLAIGTNVEAWDNDLDCLAALATTGVIKRTGTGTCSAGTIALTDLVTGTQDTVIGYFGSTTASALAINNCSNALTYSTTTHTFGCNSTAGTGTVTSAQISAGAGITVTTTSGANPCTSACNLTVSANNSMAAAKLQYFATAGSSGTITVPTGAAWMKLTLVGGGAGSPGGGTAAGTAATAGNNTCVNTSGAACTTPVWQAGGGSAASWTSSTGGNGGGCSGSGSFVFVQAGGDGEPQFNATSFAQAGSAGGNAGMGFGNGGALSKAGTAGNNGSGYGGAGQGGGAGSGAGQFTGPGSGGGGACVAFVQSPAASYTYQVAGTAAGGGAGTSGFAGGAGAGGLIIAEFGFN